MTRLTENDDHVKKVGHHTINISNGEGPSVNTYKHSPFLFIVVSVITILSLIRETTIAPKNDDNSIKTKNKKQRWPIPKQRWLTQSVHNYIKSKLINFKS